MSTFVGAGEVVFLSSRHKSSAVGMNVGTDGFRTVVGSGEVVLLPLTISVREVHSEEHSSTTSLIKVCGRGGAMAGGHRVKLFGSFFVHSREVS